MRNHWRQKACCVWHPTEDIWCALAKAERSFQQICWAFSQGVIDGVGIDVESLRALKKAECKVELVFHWIQSIVVTSILAFPFCVVDAEILQVTRDTINWHQGCTQWKLLSLSFDTRGIDCGIMSAPSPILTRAYSELASGVSADDWWSFKVWKVVENGLLEWQDCWLKWFLVALPFCSTFCVCIFYCGQRGMVKFHDCLKIARIAVPFPYSQARRMLRMYSVGDTPDESV